MKNASVKKFGNTELYVVQGDITQIPTDAIMTAINSGGMWFGGVDGAIQRIAGNLYHSQASKRMPLSDLQVVVAKGDKSKHRGQFNDVVFVVDDLQSPLDKVIYTGLEAASQQNYEKILLPAVRTGVMLGAVEPTLDKAIDRMDKGIGEFARNYGDQTNLKNITFVIYNNPELAGRLSVGLKTLEC